MLEELTVRIVMARMVPARMMNTAPLNSSINVSLRLSVVSTPQRSYWLSAKRTFFSDYCHYQGAVPVAGLIANKHQ